MCLAANTPAALCPPSTHLLRKWGVPVLRHFPLVSYFMYFFPGDRVANGSIFGDLPPNPGAMVMSHDEGKEKKKVGSITIPMENKQENVHH